MHLLMLNTLLWGISSLGVNIDNLLISQPDNGEQR